MQTYQAGNDNTVVTWASILADNTLQQAMKTARSDVISGPLALMPDCHVGMGSTIGSVIPTKSAVLPSTVGVDVGCGLGSVETTVTADQLPDDLQPWLDDINKAIPAGLGNWHGAAQKRSESWLKKNPVPDTLESLTTKQQGNVPNQLGTLGSGNHFVEVGIDEHDKVWLILHSGSRGAGNILARGHINASKQLALDLERKLEDPDLAYFLESDAGFQMYVTDLLWAQDYAMENRAIMMENLVRIFCDKMNLTPKTAIERTINCHHNYCTKENHGGEDVWITRKGAINAEVGQLGIIPGSMGTSTFIVEGLGNPDSYNSAAHGAGRLFSRTKAKKNISIEEFEKQMVDVKMWQKGQAQALLDEAPGAYKPIETIMADMTTLVKPIREIKTVLNYKGV